MLALTKIIAVTLGVVFVLALDDMLKSTSGVESVLLRTSLGISDEVTATNSVGVESILWGHLDGLSVVVESLLLRHFDHLSLAMT